MVGLNYNKIKSIDPSNWINIRLFVLGISLIIVGVYLVIKYF